MKKYLLVFIFILISAFISPSVSQAAWWNPTTWFDNWSFLSPVKIVKIDINTKDQTQSDPFGITTARTEDSSNVARATTTIVSKKVSTYKMASTTTSTTHVESKGSTDNGSYTSSADITTTIDCGNESCFDKKFAACQPATLKANVEMLGGVEYKILRNSSSGCSVSFKYTTYPDPAWVNKEMTCPFDNKLSFQDAMSKVFQGVTNGSVICTGPLYSILHKN